jgi:Cu+-exporting ATPase
MRSLTLLSFFICLLLFFNCRPTPQNKIAPFNASKKSLNELSNIVSEEYAKISINGMVCAIGCASSIQKKLNQTSGVISATVDFKSNTAWIVYNSENIRLESFTEIIKSVNDSYNVTNIEKTNKLFEK